MKKIQVRIQQDVTGDFEHSMDEAWPKALAILKSLREDSQHFMDANQQIYECRLRRRIKLRT